MATSFHGSKPGDWTKLMLFVRRLTSAGWNPFNKRTRKFLKWCSREKARRTWNSKRRNK